MELVGRRKEEGGRREDGGGRMEVVGWRKEVIRENGLKGSPILTHCWCWFSQ